KMNEGRDSECDRFGDILINFCSDKAEPASDKITMKNAWSLRVLREATEKMDHIFLSPAIHNVYFWSLEMDVECVVRRREGSIENIHKRHTFHHNSSQQEHISIAWMCVDETKGFIKDDSIIVDLRVKVSNQEGVYLSKPGIDYACVTSRPSSRPFLQPLQQLDQNIQMVSSIPQSDGSSLLVARRQREIVARVEPNIGNHQMVSPSSTSESNQMTLPIGPFGQSRTSKATSVSTPPPTQQSPAEAERMAKHPNLLPHVLPTHRDLPLPPSGATR
ncbi:hypothetical protein PMAYCL1PPCAC_28206, partial [Pristionchus mayeri]